MLKPGQTMRATTVAGASSVVAPAAGGSGAVGMSGAGKPTSSRRAQASGKYEEIERLSNALRRAVTELTAVAL